MPRKRVTQVFPFLLRARKAQKRFCFYAKMRLDRNRYAAAMASEPLPECVFADQSLLLNENTGFDMKYQRNKVLNLRIAAQPVSGILIRPGETFSFWKLVGKARGRAEYRDGLTVVDGRLVAVKGGGLCQLSNFLFWMFIHTPLSIVERHAHMVKDFPSQDPDQPDGVDATVSEGWLDLKVKNETDRTFQIILAFDDTYLTGRILVDREMSCRYEIVNREKRYFSKGGKTYERVEVCRRSRGGQAGDMELLYTDLIEIGYALPDTEKIEILEGSI